jgi:outer membrane protein insertion porin family
MIGSLCALLVTAPPPALSGDALAPYRGQPVLSVDVAAPPSEDEHMLRALIDIQPGFLVSSDDIQSSLKRLFALGRFSDVGVSAERLSGTVSLHFFVNAIRRLEHLKLSGADEVNTSALRAALRFEPGDEIDSRTAPVLRERALSYLRRAGFPSAEVTVDTLPTNDPELVAYFLRITEGRPLRVGAVRFLGHPRLDRPILDDLVRTRAGAILDRAVLDTDARTLLDAYHSHGFLNAQVETPRVEVEGSTAVVTFAIEAQDRIYVELFGNRVLSKASLMKLWPETAGEVRDNDLHVFADRVADAYRRLGYFRAKVDARGGRDVARERVVYRLVIDEGRLFRVSSIKFSGARAFEPQLLKAQLESYLRSRLDDDALVEHLTRTDVCLSAPPHLGTALEAERACPESMVPPEARWVPEVFESGLEELTAVYRNLGFLSAEVGPAEASFTEEAVEVRVPIVEGPQTFLVSIAFRGNEAFGAADLLKEVEQASAPAETGGMPIRPGSSFSVAGIEDGRIAILRCYRNLGYLYAQVMADTKVETDRKSATLVYRVEEGPQVRLQRVLVRGNRHTRDSMIRSRVSLAPGDIYRLDQALQDQRSIAALGVFANVRVKLIDEERPEELKDLVADVTERNRQPVEVFGGLSSADGPRVGASYSHINLFGTASGFTGSVRGNRKIFFDLYGDYARNMRERYDKLSSVDQLEREIRVGVHSPPLKTLPLDPAARLDLVHRRENNISYSLTSYTAILGFDFVGAYGLTFSLEPQIALEDCTDVSDVGFGCSTVVQARGPDVGKRQSFKIGPSVGFDRRDNPFNPHRGFFASAKATYVVGQQQTGGGPGFSFTNVEATLNGYIPIRSATLALSLRGGTNITLRGREPIDERFFLGGRSTLRGFPDGGVLIPEDACVVDAASPTAPAGCRQIIRRSGSNLPLTTGGNVMLLGRGEMRIPLTESLSIGLFVDVGNLWMQAPVTANLRFRVCPGAGLRYITPVGPLALDVGINTEPRPGRGEPSRPQPHFTVGVF